MGIIARPAKRSAPAERCYIDNVKKHRTSQTYQVGEPHVVISIATYDGKTGYLELPVNEAEMLLQKLAESLATQVAKPAKPAKSGGFMSAVMDELEKLK